MTTQITLPTMPATLDDWDTMREADREHVYELVEGNIRIMTPPTLGHSRIVTLIMAWLLKNDVDAGCIHAAAGLATDRRNGRVPDLIVLREPLHDAIRHVDGHDVILAVEVLSDSTAPEDRYVKPSEYAKAGVANYWIVDQAGSVLIYELVKGRYVLAYENVALAAVLERAPTFSDHDVS